MYIIYIYIYIYLCICSPENNVPSRLSPQWLYGNSCTYLYICFIYKYMLYICYIYTYT